MRIILALIEVVLTNESNGPREIFVADFSDLANPLKRTQLSSGGNDVNATWSPDGTQILFMKTIGDPWTSTEMWIMDASGLNPMHLKISFPASFAAFPGPDPPPPP